MTRVLVLILIVAVLLSGILFSIGLSNPTIESVANPTTDGSARVDPTLPRDDSATGVDVSEIERSFAPAGNSTEKPAGTSGTDAVFRGRCVDERERPLAGVEVSIRGCRKTPAGDDSPEWQDRPPTTTNATGRFEFRVSNPMPYTIDIDIEAPGRVALTVGWRHVESGLERDLGNCVLLPCTCVVRGRVADTNGLPRAGVVVQLFRQGWPFDRKYGHVGPLDIGPSALSGIDGSFQLSKPSGPGEWDCRVSYARAQLVESHTVAIELGETSKFVDLTIKSDADIATIRGIVVDELGQPIPGAQIRHCDASASERDQWISLSDFRPGNETKDKGTFVIEGENEKPGTRVLLRATKEGYQSIERSTHVWGATDLRLVLRRGVTVTVIVADAETKCPVEWFGMRMFTATDAGDRIEVALGEHAGGTVQTRPVQRGEYQCWIDPKDGKWLRTQRRISVRDDLPLEIRIQLPRAAVRTLRVESTSGKPVEGTKVEIVESTNGARVGLQRDGEEMLWCEGRTGATGGFELRGPVSKELTARILGPGHPPMLARKLLLGSSSDPILVKVPQGGTIHGKISPQEFLARMRKLGKTDLRENPPGLRLERGAPVNRPRESMPLGWVASFPLEADGSFEISEIAAGTWRLALCWRRSDGQGGGSYNSIPLGLVTDLRDGERRKLEFDLSHLDFGHVQGKVLLNGRPYTGQLDFSKRETGQEAVMTNRDGSFETLLLPGSYRISMYDHRLQLPRQIFSEDRLTLVAGQRVERTIRFSLARLRLRVVGPDGKPRSDVSVVGVGKADSEYLGATDKRGLITSPLLQPGNYQIKVWPKKYAAEKAQDQLTQEHGEDTIERFLVPVATATAKVESGEVIEISLPGSAGY